MMDLLSGRIPAIELEFRELPIRAELLDSDYEQDSAARVRYQRWINTLWQEKDARLVHLLANTDAGRAQA